MPVSIHHAVDLQEVGTPGSKFEANGSYGHSFISSQASLVLERPARSSLVLCLTQINSYATNAVRARILNNLIAIRSFEEKWISNKPELGPKRRPVGSPAVIDLQCAFGGIES